jgi:hypothetical protein
MLIKHIHSPIHSHISSNILHRYTSKKYHSQRFKTTTRAKNSLQSTFSTTSSMDSASIRSVAPLLNPRFSQRRQSSYSPVTAWSRNYQSLPDRNSYPNMLSHDQNTTNSYESRRFSEKSTLNTTSGFCNHIVDKTNVARRANVYSTGIGGAGNFNGLPVSRNEDFEKPCRSGADRLVGGLRGLFRKP